MLDCDLLLSFLLLRVLANKWCDGIMKIAVIVSLPVRLTVVVGLLLTGVTLLAMVWIIHEHLPLSSVDLLTARRRSSGRFSRIMRHDMF